MQTIKANTPSGIQALTTTREGGVSAAPFDTLNLADHVGDDAGAVATNRERLVAALDLPSAPCWLRQEHGAHVVELNGTPPVEPADAAFTHKGNIVLAVLTADCLPVVVSDRDGGGVAVVHAGWRGLAAGVVQASVDALAIDPARLQAWLGPAIGPAVYEVDDDIRDVFTRQDPEAAEAFRRTKGTKWLCNLYRLASRRLTRAGITTISGGVHCTHTEADRFFSYRRDNQCGRMATLAWIG